MWELLAPLIDVVFDVLFFRWLWYDDADEERRGCYWIGILFLLLCIVIGVVVWLVMRS